MFCGQDLIFENSILREFSYEHEDIKVEFREEEFENYSNFAGCLVSSYLIVLDLIVVYPSLIMFWRPLILSGKDETRRYATPRKKKTRSDATEEINFHQ